MSAGEAGEDPSEGGAEVDPDAGDVPSRSSRPAPSRRRRLRWAVLGALALGAATLLGLAGLNLLVTRSIDGLGYDDVADVPHRQVAIVFGAGLFGADPSPALQDRIDAAVDLYQAGRVDHLLMTGDNNHPDYDEVTAMKREAVDAGVPAEDITRDYAGLSTYDSCTRAVEVFGVHDAVLVTQDYHLARALFTCRELGIDAVGLRVPDWQHHAEELSFTYPDDMATSYTVREWLARAKAVLDTKVTHPDPTIGGDYVGLTET